VEQVRGIWVARAAKSRHQASVVLLFLTRAANSEKGGLDIQPTGGDK